MDDLAFGLRTAVIGMGIVFGLLAALWGLLALALRLDRGESAGESARAGVHGEPARRPSAPAGMEPELVAAIAIAVERHAESRRLEAAPEMRAYWPGSLLYASRWVASGRTRQNRAWQRRARG